MKRPIIITGEPFDWDEGGKYASAAVDEDGNVNWMAAMFADPGVAQCPGCKVYLWNEGERVRCPDCSTEFETPTGKWKRERTERRAP